MSYFLGISGSIEDIGCIKTGDLLSDICKNCTYSCNGVEYCFINLSYQRPIILDSLCSITDQEFSSLFPDPDSENEVILSGDRLITFQKMIFKMTEKAELTNDTTNALPILRSIDSIIQKALELHKGVEISA